MKKNYVGWVRGGFMLGGLKLEYFIMWGGAGWGGLECLPFTWVCLATALPQSAPFAIPIISRDIKN